MKLYRIGEILLEQVDALPENAQVVQEMKEGRMVLVRDAAGQEYTLVRAAADKTDVVSPSRPAAMMVRALSLANEAMFTVALQCRRLRSVEPEDDEFVLRWWADLQMLIIALSRLRLAAEIARKSRAARIARDLKNFDYAIPGLRLMRNVAEHMDAYATDVGEDKSITRRMVQTGSWDGTTFSWVRSLNIDEARLAAQALFEALQRERDRICSKSSKV